MAGHHLHVELAASVLDEGGRRAPAWRGDPEAVNALLHGAIGPDMGYFPGADGLLSGLAHYVSTDTLARALLESAKTPVEEAYAWGWLTHVLADVAVHRAVNRAAGELTLGSRDQEVTAADSGSTHVRVEVGLDGVELARSVAGSAVRLAPAFDPASIGFLATAYRATYDVDIDDAGILRSHRSVARFQPLVFRMTALIGRRHLGASLRWPDLVLLVPFKVSQWVSAVAARHSFLYGLTHTVPPSSWLARQVEEVRSTFPELFFRHLDDGLAGLREVNLDTGRVDDPADPYPLAVAAHEELDRRRRQARR